MLTRVCGEASMKKTVIVTTNWDLPASDELIGRENEIKAKYWGQIIQKGGKMNQFLQNRESALAIINNLLERADLQEPLLLQKQLVDHRVFFSETEAGKHSDSIAGKKKDDKAMLTTIIDLLPWVRRG